MRRAGLRITAAGGRPRWRAPAPRAAATCGGARGLLGFPRMRAGRGARRAESRARAPPLTCRRRHRGRATRVARALRQHRWSPPRPGRAKVTPDEPLPRRLRVPAAREAAKCMHILLSVCPGTLVAHTYLLWPLLSEPCTWGEAGTPPTSLFGSGGVFAGVHARGGCLGRVGVRGP